VASKWFPMSLNFTLRSQIHNKWAEPWSVEPKQSIYCEKHFFCNFQNRSMFVLWFCWIFGQNTSVFSWKRLCKRPLAPVFGMNCFSCCTAHPLAGIRRSCDLIYSQPCGHSPLNSEGWWGEGIDGKKKTNTIGLNMEGLVIHTHMPVFKRQKKVQDKVTQYEIRSHNCKKFDGLYRYACTPMMCSNIILHPGPKSFFVFLDTCLT